MAFRLESVRMCVLLFSELRVTCIVNIETMANGLGDSKHLSIYTVQSELLLKVGTSQATIDLVTKS